LLVAIGVVPMVLGQGTVGMLVLVTGLSALMAVSRFWQPIRPTRASAVDADPETRRFFGNPRDL
jgi:hypothetical protein